LSMSEEKLTTMKVKTSTRARLAEYGKKSETFDQIVVRLLDEVEQLKANAKLGGQSPLEEGLTA